MLACKVTQHKVRIFICRKTCRSRSSSRYVASFNLFCQRLPLLLHINLVRLPYKSPRRGTVEQVQSVCPSLGLIEVESFKPWPHYQVVLVRLWEIWLSTISLCLTCLVRLTHINEFCLSSCKNACIKTIQRAWIQKQFREKGKNCILVMVCQYANM